MNDQSQLMNQHQVNSHLTLMPTQPSQMMNHSQTMINHSQMMNQSQLMSQQQQIAASQFQMANPINQPPPQLMNVSQAKMVPPGQMIPQPPQMVNQTTMMSQNYGNWLQPPQLSARTPRKGVTFPNPMKQQAYGTAMPGRLGWKGKKAMDNKRKDMRGKNRITVPGGGAGTGTGSGTYKPPTLHELEDQNRLRARRFYPKKKYNRMGPYAHAPRNTSSFIIRAKRSGGIASLVSPCPVTPAVLPTPVFSPSKEALVEMAKEEWGVDGYGSMKGLIRLRSPGENEAEVDDYDEEEEGGSSESDVEEHVEVEKRLDHDLSRFEMIYPNSADYNNVLENRVDDQDTHIAQLEEENLILKEKLYLMESELGDLRRRLQFLERQNQVVEDIHEEVVENVSENDSDGLREVQMLRGKHNQEVDYAPRVEEDGDTGTKEGSTDVGVHGEMNLAVGKNAHHDEAPEGKSSDVHVTEGKSVMCQVPAGDFKVDSKVETHLSEGIKEICMGESEHDGIKQKDNMVLELDNERMHKSANSDNVDEAAKSGFVGDHDCCAGNQDREK